MKFRTALFHGKQFLCLNDQSAPDIDIAAVEKRACNDIISSSFHFRCALDAFAGVGISAEGWAKCSEELFVVENRKDALAGLHANLQLIQNETCALHVFSGAAADFLGYAIRKKIRFQLIDCDPFGTSYDMLPLLRHVITAGIVCVTSGEVFQVYRGINRRPGRPIQPQYKGRRCIEWVQNVLIPEVIHSVGNCRLLHYYVYPSSVRLILAKGRFRVPEDLFAGRPNVLGWLSSGGAQRRRPAQSAGILHNAD